MIEAILRGTQIRLPAGTGQPRAEDRRQLRERIERAEQRHTAAAGTSRGWLSPRSPELAALNRPLPGQVAAVRSLKRRAHRDIGALCRYTLDVPGASQRAGRFVVAEYPTDPVGARGRGCMLCLTSGPGDGSRFWWRYAAGIGDSTAAYLLFLDALLRGEHDEALHCYEALDAAGFLCDPDLDPEASIRATRTWRPALGVPEGYLHDVSDKEVATLT
ncbi:hypothetical protein AB0K09_20680 [Streptomyces sp. NPDC049577]|uniref:hypothetical protein n=1 Tax=Streptomyces sp. NPDC049577 TaxID=3155153 RepID=UPI00343AFB32